MNKKTAKEQSVESEFSIQRIYVKDVSFETPNSPDIFQTEWDPKLDLDLHIETHDLKEDFHEVVLKVTATAKLKEKTAFLIEVGQAGIFNIKGFNKEQLKGMLASFCPSILFPYARELVADLTMRGGFPPLHMAPINFDALYQQQQKSEQGKVH